RCASRSLDRWLDTFSLDRRFYLCALCWSGVTGYCRIGRLSAGFSGSLVLRNILPTPVYLRFAELPGNLRSRGSHCFQSVRRPDDVELVALDRGLECRVTLRLGGVVQFVSWKRLAGSLLDELRNSFVLRTEIINYVIL